MQNTTKKFLGLLGLALVVLLTIFAYLIPTDGAYAEEAGADTLRVVVYSQGDYPSITIDSPTTDQPTASPEVEITFTYANASKVDFTLKYTDEHGNPVEIALPSFTPDPADIDPEHGYASGTNTRKPNLRSLGLGYGHYTLEVTSSSPIGDSAGDAIEFDYVPAILTETGTDETTNDPIVEVEHDEGVKKIEVMPIDENGNPLLDEPIIINVSPDGDGNYPAGTNTVTLPFTSGGLTTGDYTILVTAYDGSDDVIESPRDTYPASYVQPLAPDVPNTGSFFSKLNVAETDYALTIGIIFAIVSAIAFRFVARKKTNYRKNIK